MVATGSAGVMRARCARAGGCHSGGMKDQNVFPSNSPGRALEIAAIRAVDERVGAVRKEAADELRLVLDDAAVTGLALTQGGDSRPALFDQRGQNEQRYVERQQEDLHPQDDIACGLSDQRSLPASV